MEPPTDLHVAPWEDAYSFAVTDRVYDGLLHRARAVVSSGRSVVLDAWFRSRTHTDRVRSLARAYGVPFYFIECRVDRSVCEQRLCDREQRPGGSDARLDILDEFRWKWEAVDELPQSQHVVVDTSLPPGVIVERLRHRLSVADTANGLTPFADVRLRSQASLCR